MFVLYTWPVHIPLKHTFTSGRLCQQQALVVLIHLHTSGYPVGLSLMECMSNMELPEGTSGLKREQATFSDDTVVQHLLLSVSHIYIFAVRSLFRFLYMPRLLHSLFRTFDSHINGSDFSSLASFPCILRFSISGHLSQERFCLAYSTQVAEATPKLCPMLRAVQLGGLGYIG